jgi:hypothetical protein
MKSLPRVLFAAALVLSASFASVNAYADAACDTKATEKKLAGAAKTSFLKKCNADAAAAAPAGNAACDAKAAEKKLHGAAKNSFVKKCVADAAKS